MTDIWSEAQTFHDAWAITLDQDVCAAHEIEDEIDVFRAFEITLNDSPVVDMRALLPPIEMSGTIDTQHCGAEIGENPSEQSDRTRRRNLQDFQSLKRTAHEETQCTISWMSSRRVRKPLAGWLGSP